MKYDFDTIISRRDTNSHKWDSAQDTEVLPMSIADMDFYTAPAIIDALHRRIEHGIFGYTKVPKTYYDAVTGWFKRRHKWAINKEWIIYTSGVVPALSAIIKALTIPGDKVLVQTPVYTCFFSSIVNNGCEIILNPLLYKQGTYQINFDDLEHKVSDTKVKLMLLCNPHNPVGRVWTREELTRIGEICFRNQVVVVSDEIHCELIFSGHRYIPFASIEDEFLQKSITCISPSKSFNIAGLQIANIVVADTNLRSKINRAINVNEVCDVNPFGVEATIAAYNEGENWLLQLIAYIQENYWYMQDFCRQYLPNFPITTMEGTYLVWMDCSMLNKSSKELQNLLIENNKLWLNAGTMYGEEGEGFLRWNIACPKALLIKGLTKFLDFVKHQ